MEDILQGTDGESFYQASAWSRFTSIDNEAENIPPIHGRDLQLTIDARYQEIAQRELEAAVEYSGSEWAAAVLLDPATGDVLAMASYPVFNEDGSLARNHCVQSTHEPGSVFKTITLAAGLDGGYAVLADSFDCRQNYVELFGHRIHESHPIGEFLDLTGVISHSSNVGTIQLADRIPDSEFYEYCRAFGLGEKPGWTSPGSRGASFPNPHGGPAFQGQTLPSGRRFPLPPFRLPWPTVP